MAGNSGVAARGKPFVPGQSGNPSGRPKMDGAVKEMLKDAALPAVQLLIDTMQDNDTKPELRIKCAETILERVYGKSPQPIEGLGDNIIQLVIAGELQEFGG